MTNIFIVDEVRLSQRLSSALLVFFILLQPGCSTGNPPVSPAQSQITLVNLQFQSDRKIATSPMPDTHFQSALGNVAVVVKAPMPDNWSREFPPSKGEAAASSYGRTMYKCMGIDRAKENGGGGDPIFLIVWGAVCGVVVAPIGSISAAVKASSADVKENSVKTVSEVLTRDAIERIMFDQILKDASSNDVKLATVSQKYLSETVDYKSLVKKGVDTVLFVTLENIVNVTHPNGQDPLLNLEIKAEVRLINTRDSSEIFNKDFYYYSKKFKYEEWTANNGYLLSEAVKSGLASLGDDISVNVFTIYPYPYRSPQGEGYICGISPLASDEIISSSLSPVLSWQDFPRRKDISSAPNESAQMKNVRYEIVIGTGDRGESPQVIYRRSGLLGSSHKVEIELNPSTLYFWSVRASFKLNGRQRVTEWSTHCPFQPQLFVGSRLYKFLTPKS